MKRTRSFLAALGACALGLAVAACDAGAAPAGRIVLPAGVTPVEYRLAIEAHPDGTLFDGQVDIDVRVAQPTNRIVLNSAELQIARATLDDLAVPAAVAFDPRRETATFTFAHRLVPGLHTLHVAYQVCTSTVRKPDAAA